ncbi:MAG: hypothetical protein NT026_00610 [Candidatus Staskawiczbacteria bacterium]|nr:hypothetical protein [Candidatus Staskawiczbacteria bacterium]
MSKVRDFSFDLDQLAIAQKAKRVIEGFLDAECTPSAGFNPAKANKLRRAIMREVSCVAPCRADLPPDDTDSMATYVLSRALADAAEGHRNENRNGLADKLEELAELIRDVASKPRQRKSKKKG